MPKRRECVFYRCYFIYSVLFPRVQNHFCFYLSFLWEQTKNGVSAECMQKRLQLLHSFLIKFPLLHLAKATPRCSSFDKNCWYASLENWFCWTRCAQCVARSMFACQIASPIGARTNLTKLYFPCGFWSRQKLDSCSGFKAAIWRSMHYGRL